MGKVAPGGVLFFDQEDFFGAAPAFELFFAGDGVARVAEGFEIDELGGVIGLGEAGDLFLLVLHYAGVEVVGYADIENAGLAGHDVDVINHAGDFCMVTAGSNREKEKRGIRSEKRGPSTTQPNHLAGARWEEKVELLRSG